MHRTMMPAAERDRELIADLAAELPEFLPSLLLHGSCRFRHAAASSTKSGTYSLCRPSSGRAAARPPIDPAYTALSPKKRLQNSPRGSWIAVLADRRQKPFG